MAAMFQWQEKRQCKQHADKNGWFFRVAPVEVRDPTGKQKLPVCKNAPTLHKRMRRCLSFPLLVHRVGVFPYGCRTSSRLWTLAPTTLNIDPKRRYDWSPNGILSSFKVRPSLHTHRRTTASVRSPVTGSTRIVWVTGVEGVRDT